MNFKPLRFLYAVALIAVLFTPFGVYHSLSEAGIYGTLWGYYLPIGYLGLALGLLVMIYPKTGLDRKLSFAWFMIGIGFVLLVAFIFTPKEYFVSLWHHASPESALIEIDYPIGNWLVWGLVLLSVAGGLMLKMCEKGTQKQ